MTINSKINRIKIGLVVFYILSFFIPVYSKTVNNTVYKVSIFKLNAGLVFLIVLAVAIVTTIVLYVINQTYHRYSYYAMLGLMTGLLVLLIFFKEDDSTIRIAVYLQILITVLLTTAYFFEDWTVWLFDTIYKLLKRLFIALKNGVVSLVGWIKRKLENRKQAKQNTVPDEEDAQ